MIQCDDKLQNYHESTIYLISIMHYNFLTTFFTKLLNKFLDKGYFGIMVHNLPAGRNKIYSKILNYSINSFVLYVVEH